MRNNEPRILHVLKSSIYSGAENVVITVINYFQNKYNMAYLAAQGEIEEALIANSVPYYLIENYGRKGIAKIISEFQPDIVHAHDFAATVICASIPGRFCLISHLHYDPPWIRKWNLKSLIYTISALRVDKVLTVSRKAYEHMVFADRLKDKYEAVGNPIDKDKIIELSNSGQSEVKYDLLFVGRLVRQKNPQRFLRIVKALKEREVYLNCAILGDGELRGECEQMIKQYGLEGQVHLLGFSKNPYSYMKAAKLLCITSRYEGYGLVALEANILNTPVLSTCTAGALEILGSGAEELCDTDEEFMIKIQALLSDDEKYQLWEKNTQERVLNMLPIDKYLGRLDEIYHELL